MGRFVLGVCLMIWLTIAAGAGAAAASAPAESPPPPRLEQSGPSADDTAPLAFPDVSKIDPRLAFVGVGVLIGLVIASPGLELSEVLGIALGVIGSQYLYYSLAPRFPDNFRPHS